MKYDIGHTSGRNQIEFSHLKQKSFVELSCEVNKSIRTMTIWNTGSIVTGIVMCTDYVIPQYENED